VQHGRTKDLLGGIERPDLERPLRPLLPPLVDERHQGQRPECGLHEQREGTQQLALPGVLPIGPIVKDTRDGGRKRWI